MVLFEAAEGQHKVADLRAGLGRTAQGWRAIGAGPGAWMLDEFLVHVGIICQPQPLPLKYPVMTPKMCFANAARLVRRRPGLRYCEGYTINTEFPLPLLHAWAIDRENRVVDPTLREPMFYQYIGYPMALAERRKWVTRQSQSVFDTGRGMNLRFMLTHYPALRDLVSPAHIGFVDQLLAREA